MTSYTITIGVQPVPEQYEDACQHLARLRGETGPPHPLFEELLTILMDRYPCPSDATDEDSNDAVWTDIPLRDRFGPRSATISFVASRTDEVLPFLIKHCLALGLVVFDHQTGIIHWPPSTRAKPWWKFW